MVQSTSISTVAGEEQLSALSEEGLNQLTHGIGFALSVGGAAFLLTRPALSAVTFFGCAVYAVSMVALYAASTLSHSFEREPLRTRFRTLDQICIFTFMAGIFTPISLACCDGWWHLPLIAMWLMTGIGTWLKLFVTKTEMVPVWFYMTLGAVPMIAFPQILAFVGTTGMMWILGAACCYLVGIIFLTNDHRVKFFHPVWHVLVIMGSICHYIAILQYTVLRDVA